MPLAFPSSHSKCLSCRLAVWFFHWTFHSSESCTEGSLAWTAPGLWSLEVGAGSSVILSSTGCCETSLTALVLANLKGYVSFSYCHYASPNKLLGVDGFIFRCSIPSIYSLLAGVSPLGPTAGTDLNCLLS